MRQMHSSWCLPGSVGRIYAVYVLRHAEGARVLQFVFFSLTVLFALLGSVTLPVTPQSSTLPAGLV